MWGFFKKVFVADNLAHIADAVFSQAGPLSAPEALVGVYAFEQRNEIIIAYHVRASGEVRLGDEIAQHKIVAREKLRPWPFGTGLAVSDWLANK